MAQILMLVRHGDTGKQFADRYIGSTDIPLAEKGREQAVYLAGRIRREMPESCLCSPLRRCIQTAKIISRPLRISPEIDPDLREIDFGNWEGLTFEDIARKDPAGVHRWARFDPDFAFPEGETIGEFLSRTRRVAARLRQMPEKTVLVSTHGGVIRMLICHYLGLSPRHYILFRVLPGSLATIELAGTKGVLTGLNETGTPEDFQAWEE
ncbi:MAG: histidine phosphatase family protein [Syntrophales bacterium]